MANYPMQGIPGDAKTRQRRWKGRKTRAGYWSTDASNDEIDYWTEAPMMRVAKADGTSEMKSIADGRPFRRLTGRARVDRYGTPYKVDGFTKVDIGGGVEVEGFFGNNTKPTKRKLRFHKLIHHLVKSAFAEIHAVNLTLPKEERYVFYIVSPYNPRYIKTPAILQNYGELWEAMGYKKPLKREGKTYTLKAGEAWEGGSPPTGKSERKQVVDASSGDPLRRAKWAGFSQWREIALAADIWRKVPKLIGKKKNVLRPTEEDWEGSDAYPKGKGDGWMTNSRVSLHTFGTAMDINYHHNGNGSRPRRVKSFDIPPWVASIFLNHGFYWGGLYGNSGDHMHFEYEQEHILQGPIPPLPPPKRPGARTWVYPVPNKTAEQLYALNEGGSWGYYPIGGTNAWHGGIHLPVSSEVRCVADGRIVAARAPEKDVGSTSNSFVLVRHELPIETSDSTKIAWSLYAHLKPFTFTSDSPDAPSWVKPLLAEAENAVAGIDPKKKYLEVLVEEDRDLGAGGDDPRVGLNLRETKKRGDVLAVLRPGTLVEVLKQGKWAKVKVLEGDATGTEGFLLTRKWRGRPRVRRVDPAAIERAAQLKSGAVVALNIPVKAGEKLADVGRHAGESSFHMEVFAEDALHGSMPELAGFLSYSSDTDADALLDDDGLKVMADALGSGSFDGVVRLSEAREAAKSLRSVAVRFTSEWGAGGWERLKDPPWNVTLLAHHKRYIASQQWWKQAKQAHKVAKTESSLPSSPLLWHYHPVTLISQLQKAYGEHGSQAVASP